MKNTATKPLKIAIVIDDFYPASGGIARSVQTQIHELTRLGHKVTLIAPKYYLERSDDCQTLVVPSFYLPGTPSYMCIIGYSRRQVRKINQKHQFDIVHSQTERGALMLASRLASSQNIPHVHTFHANLAGTHESNRFPAFWGSMAYLLLINPWLALTSKKRFNDNVVIPKASSDATSFWARFDWHSFATIASRVDAYATPAKFMQRRINDCSPGFAGKGDIISTGVNPLFSQAIAQTKRSRAIDDQNVRFLCVSRLSKEKRACAAVKAFIKADMPNSRLDIVGSGDQLNLLIKLANGHKNIFFHNHISGISELAKFYVDADVFILPSFRFDTQAITLSEAAVAGLPIIYCDDRLDVGVNTSNSLLTDGPDAESIAKCMRQLSDQKLRQSMSTASTKIAQKLTPEIMARKYVKLYEQELSSKNK